MKKEKSQIALYTQDRKLSETYKMKKVVGQ